MLRRWRRTERTRGGDPVYRHTITDRAWAVPAFGDEDTHAAIDAHYARFVDGEATVWHEIISDLIHIDVFMWRPTERRPMFTLATQGMSNLPMRLPRAARRAGASDRAELVMCLPPDWPVPDDSLGELNGGDDRSSLPIRSLKTLARLPHDFRTWLGSGHTIPNGDPPEPFHDDTELIGWTLLPPTTLPPESRRLFLPDGSPIDLFGVVALTADEMDLKVGHGMEALLPHLERNGVSELLAIDRPSVLAI